MQDHLLVIFGASGDLTKRKLIPALFELHQQKLLPKKFAVLGVSRTEISDEVFRGKMREFLPSAEGETLELFLKSLYYQAIETSTPDEFPKLKTRLESMPAPPQLGGQHQSFRLDLPGLCHPQF